MQQFNIKKELVDLFCGIYLDLVTDFINVVLKHTQSGNFTQNAKQFHNIKWV